MVVSRAGATRQVEACIWRGPAQPLPSPLCPSASPHAAPAPLPRLHPQARPLPHLPPPLQFNLFGGTVLKLGTARHHAQLLRGITTLDDVGCFALTELGFGEGVCGCAQPGGQKRRGREAESTFCCSPPLLLAARPGRGLGAWQLHSQPRRARSRSVSHLPTSEALTPPPPPLLLLQATTRWRCRLRPPLTPPPTSSSSTPPPRWRRSEGCGGGWVVCGGAGGHALHSSHAACVVDRQRLGLAPLQPATSARLWPPSAAVSDSAGQAHAPVCCWQLGGIAASSCPATVQTAVTPQSCGVGAPAGIGSQIAPCMPM